MKKTKIKVSSKKKEKHEKRTPAKKEKIRISTSPGKKVVLVKRVKIKKTVRKKTSGGEMNKIWVDVLLPDLRVRKWLVQVIGEHAIHVIREFDKELSDEDISKKTELRPSDVRVVLNRLHAHGLATYSRSRDKNSGWYSYNWKLEEQHAQQLAQGIVKETDVQVEQEPDEREKYFCIVDGEKVIYAFEEAMQNNFKCPRSGQDLKYLE